jgi:hypothetical protein
VSSHPLEGQCSCGAPGVCVKPPSATLRPGDYVVNIQAAKLVELEVQFNLRHPLDPGVGTPASVAEPNDPMAEGPAPSTVKEPS